MLHIQNDSTIPVVVFTSYPDGGRSDAVIEPGTSANFDIGDGVQVSAREYTEGQQPEGVADTTIEPAQIGGAA